MPQRVIGSLLMLLVICLTYVVILLIQRVNREQYPSVFWSNPRIALVAIAIFAGIDVFCYLLGYWPLSRTFQIAKSAVLWSILLVIMIRLVIFISNYKSSNEQADELKD